MSSAHESQESPREIVARIRRITQRLFDDLEALERAWALRQMAWKDILRTGEELWGRLRYAMLLLEKEDLPVDSELFEEARGPIEDLQVALLWCINPASHLEKIRPIPDTTAAPRDYTRDDPKKLVDIWIKSAQYDFQQYQEKVPLGFLGGRLTPRSEIIIVPIKYAKVTRSLSSKHIDIELLHAPTWLENLEWPAEVTLGPGCSNENLIVEGYRPPEYDEKEYSQLVEKASSVDSWTVGLSSETGKVVMHTKEDDPQSLMHLMRKMSAGHNVVSEKYYLSFKDTLEGLEKIDIGALIPHSYDAGTYYQSTSIMEYSVA